MDSRYYGRSAARPSYTIDLSDVAELYSTSEDEINTKAHIDRQLAQAVNYLIEGGGDDSTATFMDRVNRIDAALIQQLPQQGVDFNIKLYRRVRDMVRDFQVEFETAANEQSSLMELDDTVSDCSSPSPLQALYRESDDGDESPTRKLPRRPTVSPLTQISSPPTRGVGGTVELERTYKYGGPGGQPEKWNRAFPAMLPFPETHQLAHWESLKIAFDLSEAGKQLKADGKVVETIIPFDHRALEQYKDLHQYDSGSRFKFPNIEPQNLKKINEYTSLPTLEMMVEGFNKGVEKKENGKDYTPRIFLENFRVRSQGELLQW